MSKMKKLRKLLEEFGIKYLLSSIVHFVLKKIHVYTEVELIKEKLVKRIANESHYTVRHGLFVGLKFHKAIWWGKYDVINKVYGNYEA